MMLKQTKIVASISDQRCEVEFIRDLFKAGMNVVRMNTAHASREGFEKLITNVREVSNRIAILMDTKGPEVRTTAIAGGEPIPYQIGDKVKIVGNPAQETTRECIAVSYPGFVHDLQVDGDILIDDGDLELRVIEKTDEYLLCEVQNEATLGNRKSVNVEEIDLLIGSIDRSTKEGQRNRAILETLYSCGLRVSELCNLKLSELYFEEGFIKVEGKGSKQRLVPISPRAIKEIRLYFTDRNLMKIKPGFEDFVFISNFGKNISRIMVFHIIKELAARIGLKKKISPHTFRHSFATHLLEGGANLRAIQCMLGHESIGTTEIYTHIDRNMLRSEIIEHHPRNIKFREKDNKGSIF